MADDFSAAPSRGRIYESVLDTIGATPLVRIPRLQAEERLGATVLLKLEFFNPLGSVKDRIGLAMIDAAEAAGAIAPGRSVLVEPTSGNTGIALGFVAAARGYRLIVCMPEGASVERRKMLRLMGAEVQSTPARLGMAGAIAIEKLDRVFRSAAQVEEATGVSVLAMVPEVKGTAAARSNVVTNILENTTSPAAEAVRAVRK